MTKKKKKILKITGGIIGGIVIILLLCGFWLYSGKLTSAKLAVFRTIPYPLTLVNNRPIFMKDFLLRLEVSKKMSGAEVIAQREAEVKSQIYNKMVEEEKYRQVAAKHKVSVSQKEIDEQYKIRASQSDLQGKKNYEELLASFGLSAGSYKNQVIVPDLLQANLQTWFNSQEDLNKATYLSSNSIIDRLKKGENMVILAVGLTQDETERGVGGDLGFVDPSELLPELREPVSAMKLGDVRVIPSRFGLHIIRAEEQDGNKLHLREIFLKGENFDKWYQEQTKNFKVRQLVSV
jgi:parvulin-like peptidyl-prolyl isomerase